MRAAVVEEYGPPEVVRVVDLPQPRPRRGEVLVRVHASAVTSADARIRGARFPRGFGPFARLAFGVRRPRRPVLGGVYSGVVTEVGPDGRGGAADFSIGDAVCGMTGIRLGTHAEYVAVPATKVVALPEGVTHDQAAALLFGGSTALHFLRDRAGVEPGATVLIIGASGAIGTTAIPIARHLGGVVTAVTSGANADLVRSLGAERVVDYTREEVAGRFDVVLDCVGTLTPVAARALLTPGGTAVLAVATLGQTLRARGNVVAGAAPERPADLATLLEMTAAGVLSPVIERTYDLDEIVEAHRRVNSGRKAGNLVLHP